MNVDPGELNRRVEIGRDRRTQDADGYWTSAWETVHCCWAKVTRQSVRELQERQADRTETRLRVLIRYTSKPIHRKMALFYGGGRYEIETVNDYGDRHEYIEIEAVRKTEAAT